MKFLNFDQFRPDSNLQTEERAKFCLPTVIRLPFGRQARRQRNAISSETNFEHWPIGAFVVVR